MMFFLSCLSKIRNQKSEVLIENRGVEKTEWMRGGKEKEEVYGENILIRIIRDFLIL